jgi:hypothetical protein
LLQIGVSTLPGSTSTTRTPQARSSPRSALVMPRIANFDAQYTEENGTPNCPRIEPTLMIRPRVWRSSGRQACETRIRPSTLTSSRWRAASSDVCSIGPPR